MPGCIVLYAIVKLKRKHTDFNTVEFIDVLWQRTYGVGGRNGVTGVVYARGEAP